MKLATPIIVIGMNRSGTKWLSNLLCNHPEVAGIQTQAHTGALETDMFGNMQTMFGDLSLTENYVAFVEAWSQTDFFKASGCPKEIFYARPRPQTYLEAFRLLMDDFATRRAARFWLQKSSPLFVRRVLEFLGTCKVICLRRDLDGTITSTVQLARTTSGSDSLLRNAFHYAYQEKVITAVEHEFSALSVLYEDLEQDTANVLKQICHYIGIEFQSAMVVQKFRRNTSFPTVARDEVLSRTQLRFVRTMVTALQTLPLGAFDRSWQMLRNRSPYLVEGTYREIEQRYGLR